MNQRKNKSQYKAYIFAVKYGRSIRPSIIGQIMQQNDQFQNIKKPNTTSYTLRIKSDKVLKFKVGLMTKIEKALEKN